MNWGPFMTMFQMDNNKLKLGSVIGVGVLASALVIGTGGASTYSTVLESINTESQNEAMWKDYMVDYTKSAPQFSFPNDLISIGEDAYEEDFPEIELVEIPVVKKIVFQFKRPVKLEFS